MTRGRDPRQSAAAAAFVLMSLGYIIRERVTFGPAATLLLGVLPNLAGCAAVPLIVAPMLRRRLHGRLVTDRATALLGALTGLAGAVAIELLHVAFSLGSFDWNDMIASVVGSALGVVALLAIDSRVLRDRRTLEAIGNEA